MITDINNDFIDLQGQLLNNIIINTSDLLSYNNILLLKNQQQSISHNYCNGIKYKYNNIINFGEILQLPPIELNINGFIYHLENTGYKYIKDSLNNFSNLFLPNKDFFENHKQEFNYLEQLPIQKGVGFIYLTFKIRQSYNIYKNEKLKTKIIDKQLYHFDDNDLEQIQSSNFIYKDGIVNNLDKIEINKDSIQYQIQVTLEYQPIFERLDNQFINMKDIIINNQIYDIFTQQNINNLHLQDYIKNNLQQQIKIGNKTYLFPYIDSNNQVFLQLENGQLYKLNTIKIKDDILTVDYIDYTNSQVITSPDRDFKNIFDLYYNNIEDLFIYLNNYLLSNKILQSNDFYINQFYFHQSNNLLFEYPFFNGQHPLFDSIFQSINYNDRKEIFVQGFGDVDSIYDLNSTNGYEFMYPIQLTFINNEQIIKVIDLIQELDDIQEY